MQIPSNEADNERNYYQIFGMIWIFYIYEILSLKRWGVVSGENIIRVSDVDFA